MTSISTLPVPGTEFQVVIIDDFMPGPHKLVDYALSNGKAPKDELLYPGLRMPAPAGYLRYALATINLAFKKCRIADTLSDGEAYFAMVTRPPAELTTEQSIPHFDRPYSHEYAVVHYLCSPAFGGTSIYRYNPTGQVAVTEATLNRYQQSLDAELAALPVTPGYINGDTRLFSRVAQVPCAFNRAVIYPCALLHSGDIPANFIPDLNPYTGRFTVTAFLR
ncbi:DUF6445 family protein [Marisediminitalea sp.]|uniref:DUF6445 family protein n=1 Tax=Marisediminitalea sp. TaxID=2662268 RepID=UPI0035163944|tara:strand:+ start:1426 stop:2088 length:663 start_codon:yes stop_codon:yes gene_type:complete